MAAMVPLAVTLSTSQPAWDDAWFLDRAVCFNRTVFALSFHGAMSCLTTMFKSPVMAILLLPAGPLNQGNIDQLALAPIVLACVAFVMIAWLACLTYRCKMTFLPVLAAAVAIGLCQPIRDADAPYLVDGCYAILITIALLLPVLEISDPVAVGRDSHIRGMSWGAVLTFGLLAKASFIFFAAPLASLLLYASYRRSGGQSTWQKTIAAAMTCIPLALMFARFGKLYLINGWRASFGSDAVYYGDEKPLFQSIAEICSTAGIAYWLILAALAVVAIFGKRNPDRLAVIAGAICITLAYLLLSSLSRNTQPRFLWCIWLALPILLASAMETARPRVFSRTSIAAIAAACLAAGYLSTNMISRFDFTSVRAAVSLLRSLAGEADVTFMIASDTPGFNINTLLLAQQLDWKELRGIRIRTVVYDRAEGKSVNESDQQTLKSRFVFISDLHDTPPGPSITYGLTPRFLALSQRCGKLVEKHEGPLGALLFDMRNTPCLQ